MNNTVNKIISELQNKNILIIIFEFLDCSTLINCRMVTPLWAKLLLESSKLWEISFKNTYPFLYHQLIVKTPEEKLLIKELPDLDNLSWFLKTKMVLSKYFSCLAVSINF